MTQQRRPRRRTRNTRAPYSSNPSSRNSHQDRPEPAPKPLPEFNEPPEAPLEGVFKTLSYQLQHAVAKTGYTTPTPIQEQAIPPVKHGEDLLGCAQTGTGKTAAFALPMLHRLTKSRKKGAAPRTVRALILSPTRELANQISDDVKNYGQFVDFKHAVIYGGVGQGPQVKAVRSGVDLLIATPGRLMDLMQQGHIKLNDVEIFVLDEADRMMDMGFINDVKKIISKMPAKRQNLMFSATMPRNITELAQSLLNNPVDIRIAPEKVVVDSVDQSIYFADNENKVSLLKHVLEDEAVTRAVVFIRTKRRADRLERQLKKADIPSDVIHSGRSQNQRDRTISKFRSGKTRVLVASDVISRGLDVDDVSHVINFDMPQDAETYVHRIGRTGRAGETGLAFSFCAHEERGLLKDVERHLKKSINRVEEHPYVSTAQPRRDRAMEPRADGSPPYRGRGGRGGGANRRGRANRGKRFAAAKQS